MQTSLRYDSDSRALRIHAKEKIPVDSNIHCQVHGELDTNVGAPSSLALIFRNFYPEFSASVGAGIWYDQDKKIKYSLRGKKAFQISSNGFVSLNVKGRLDVDDKLKEELLWRSDQLLACYGDNMHLNFTLWTSFLKKTIGAAELSWSVLDFKSDQDVRFKVGYEVFEKMPYLQLRENNWTFNADMNGRWKVRFDM
ncbi:outer envelope pore protein 21B, chloroplastic-like isoform X1 [Aristolochia californica]|uniref:outer envelope pore protein 21B, chloroplastic-like isoform X1 n=1 Tax=Aristolochia californica TaxID=171875 RepID=UPI0035DEF4BF